MALEHEALTERIIGAAMLREAVPAFLPSSFRNERQLLPESATDSKNRPKSEMREFRPVFISPGALLGGTFLRGKGFGCSVRKVTVPGGAFGSGTGEPSQVVIEVASRICRN